MTMRSKIRVLLAARAGVLAVVALAGCNTDQVEPPSTATDTNAGPTGDPVTTGEPDGTSSGTAEAPTTGDTGDVSSSSGGEVETTGTPAECEGDGCFACKPSKHVELLNACTDATCEPFNNTQERLPLLGDDGTLPPLP